MVAGGAYLPDYPASDQNHLKFVGLPYFVYRGELVRSDREGTRAKLWESAYANIELSAAASFATESKDDVARQGMPNLDYLLEIGPRCKRPFKRLGWDGQAAALCSRPWRGIDGSDPFPSSRIYVYARALCPYRPGDTPGLDFGEPTDGQFRQPQLPPTSMTSPRSMPRPPGLSTTRMADTSAPIGLTAWPSRSAIVSVFLPASRSGTTRAPPTATARCSAAKPPSRRSSASPIPFTNPAGRR